MQGETIIVPDGMAPPSPFSDAPPLSEGDMSYEGLPLANGDSGCAGRVPSPSGRLMDLPKEALAQHALLAKKLRLNKLLSRESFTNCTNHRIPSRGPINEDDLRADIRVLSPSLVNSQVLPKTRPLSPEPLSPIKPQTQNENVNSSKIRWKEIGGRRKKQEGEKKVGKEENEEKNQDKESNKGKGRGRRRPRIFKLKFHHQALPPEYLDHYEASLRLEQRNGLLCEKPEVGFLDTKQGPRETIKEGLQCGLRKNRNIKSQRNSRPITIHEAGGGATDALLRDLLLANPQLHQAALQQAAIARAQSVPSIMLASVGSPQRLSYQHYFLPPPSPDSSMCTDDRSSQASDMSIDEFPKRRRKSKKDMNLLMGRGLSGIGLGNSITDRLNQAPQQFTKIENPEMSTTEIDRDSLDCSNNGASLVGQQNEPLNLCIRDESSYINSFRSQNCFMKGEEIPRKIFKRQDSKESDESRLHCSPPIEYPPWNFGQAYTPPHWIHDYRQKVEDGFSSGQSTPSVCSQSSHLTCMSPPTWPHFSPPPQISSPQSLSPASPLSPMIPPHHSRHIQAFIKESLHHKFEEANRERLSPRENLVTNSGHSDRNSPKSQKSQTNARNSPLKVGRRKRSALFIPPSDPSTEVSICKFKFTGGANPMLEEKKMVSVDAAGTLRYFSGPDRTRDLRNQQLDGRIPGRLLENLSKCEKDVKKIRLESDTDDTCSLPVGGIETSSSCVTTSPTCTLQCMSQSPIHLPPQIEDSPKRKRRSKKSTVREKLEQTLREKGLLIQTQQVESAEGATYCKFRQLRKITRYLFRSWKDYLPGHEGGIHRATPVSRSSQVHSNRNAINPSPMSVKEYD